MSAKWPPVVLSEVVEVKHGWAFKGNYMSEDADEGAVVVAIGNFDYSGGFRFSSTKLKRYSGSYPREYQLQAGDILLAMTCQTAGGEILGLPGMIPDDGELYLHNQRLGKLIVKQPDCVYAPYLYWVFLSYDFNRYLAGSATGTKILHTSPSKIVSYEARLPPVDVQKDIARFLWAISDKVELNQKINQTLEEIALAIFKSWFVDFEPVKAKVAALEAGEDILLAAMQAISGKSVDELTRLQAGQPEQYAELRATAELFPSAMQESELGEMPVGWEVAPFSEVAMLYTKSVKPGDEPERLWEHFSIPAFDESKAPALELGEDIKSNKYRVDPNSVLVSKLNPHFPRTWWPEPIDHEAAICSTEFMQFVPKSPELRPFVAGMIASQPFQQGIMMRVTGSTGSRQRAQPKQVATMDVLLPPESLALEYSRRTASMYVAQARNIKQSQILAQLRDILLPKLLSGELTIPEAEEQVVERQDVAHV